MSSPALLEQFDVMTRAPNGVQKIRELTLQLAVRGQLVPQDRNDEPASLLVQRIAAERERLVGEGVLQSAQPASSITERDVPFVVPSGWEWVRFGYATFNRDGERVPVSSEIRAGRRGPYPYYGASGAIDTIDDYLFDKPLLLIGEDGANLLLRSTPIAFLAEGKYWVNNHAHVIDGLSPELLHYVKVFINATDLAPYVTGTAQPKLNQAKLNSIPVALPPLAEQQRIVRKVDELMALCDRLEARQRWRAAVRTRLSRSALHHLTDASSDAEFSAHWQRVRENFEVLYDAPEMVAELRRGVLQLAVRGRLTRQNLSDEPASLLLRHIAAEKQQLFRAGKIDEPKPGLQISANEAPFAAPRGWEWARFADVATIASNLVDPADYADEPHIAPDNIEKGTGRLLAYHSVREDAVTSNKHRFFSGQILYSKIRPNLSKAILVDFGGLCSADMYPLDAHISPRYLLTYILSSTFLSMVIKNDTRVAMPKINQAELSRVMVPVPPLAEQHRIAARVDELLALCATLEVRLTSTQDKSAHVAASVLHHLTVA